MTRSDFEDRQKRRRERLIARAEKAEREAKAGQAAADRILDAIPFGQPILVGHHSEKRHRRDIERMDRGMRRAIEKREEAKDLRSRAGAVGTGGVSSDDPEVLAKLKGKLASLEAEQEGRKRLNSAWRKAGKPAPDESDGWTKVGELLGQTLEDLSPLRLEMAKRWSFQQGAPFPRYSMTNLSAEVRRVRERIEATEDARSTETKETDYGVCRIVENVEENRLQLVFQAKPDDETRGLLKRFGFRWSPTQGAWQRFLNPRARASALALVGALKGSDETKGGARDDSEA